MGLALDEPNETYRTYNSNSIDVYIHPDLADQLQPLGGVDIDFIDNGPRQQGFTIRTKSKPAGADCSGCGTDSDGCG